MQKIDPLTIKAYLETEYIVSGVSVLRLGIANDELLNFYKKFKVDQAAFITAYNPFSQFTEAAINAARQAELAKELNQRSLSFFEGAGRPPTGGWPAEPSYFVLGLSRETAKKLGKKYNQNAIVWCGTDAVPELVLLR